MSKRTIHVFGADLPRTNFLIMAAIVAFIVIVALLGDPTAQLLKMLEVWR